MNHNADIATPLLAEEAAWRGPDGLAALEERLWQELSLAAATKGHGWRIAALATVGPDGLPDARNVVLREVDPAMRRLCFFTDARAPKVTHLRHQPQAVLLMWCPRLAWQLRLTLNCEVQEEGLAASSRWAQLKLTPAALDYLSQRAPGTTLAPQDLPTAMDPAALAASAALQAPALSNREYFAMVMGEVRKLDWLGLAPGGHRRAQFSAGAEPCWLQP